MAGVGFYSLFVSFEVKLQAIVRAVLISPQKNVVIVARLPR
jgi:hypothetical protein